MQTRMLCMFGVLLFVLACGKKDEPTAPPALNISGTFTGIGLSGDNRIVNFEITLSHVGDNVTGTGSYRLSGAFLSGADKKIFKKMKKHLHCKASFYMLRQL